MTKRRSSKARQTVLSALRQAGAFRSAQSLHRELAVAGSEIGLATVYRNLQALAEDGEVDQVRVEGAEALYRICDQDGHHHHVICRSCGRSVAVTGPDFEFWADNVAEAAGFAEVRHALEISGICRQCVAQRSRPDNQAHDAARSAPRVAAGRAAS
ncbi:MAG: transcriptional repressor [Bifidobacteriaceae bacterium]|jgi:Fur family ferric uptake transcriptional regulator|nr:transcriptional repressor [Bifidobacteriaceae bacterium]